MFTILRFYNQYFRVGRPLHENLVLYLIIMQIVKIELACNTIKNRAALPKYCIFSPKFTIFR